MSSFAHKKTEDGLTSKYHISLKRQIENGDRSLVCRNVEFFKEVEALLWKGNAKKIHNLFRLDTLTVMEKSLLSFPSKTGQMGLEKLSKAFEVLELAALNLYIYPWRREYRLVKMFSGMFTHLIKPTLTLKQAEELFGLLGYEPSSANRDEELALNPKPVPADFLLSLACGFFTARMECQLLLSASGSVKRDVKWVLQLVRERQAGHSLQIALENTKAKSDADKPKDDVMTGGINSEVDLYTEQNASRMMSSSCSTPSEMMNNDEEMQDRSFNNAEDQIEDNAPKVMCKCITLDDLFIYQCEKCKRHHSSQCSHYKECILKGHAFTLTEHKAEDFTQHPPKQSKEKSKDAMKTHSCVASSTSTSFLVCYDCQYIHDHNCNSIKACSLNHNVQPTGKLHPPQEERPKTLKQHTCLTAKTSIYAICHTCKCCHDNRCEDLAKCLKYAHHLEYSHEMGESETPIPYHPSCWKGSYLVPESVCLDCKLFHFSGCPDRRHCSEIHKLQVVGTECITCSSSDLFTLCRYCCAPYCKLCFFRNTMLCKCGKSLGSCSTV